MLRSHLMGIKLMRRLPWPLALPVRWSVAGDPDRPSATWYAQLCHLSLARKHRCFRLILRPWHDRYHGGKSDTGPASFGTASRCCFLISFHRLNATGDEEVVAAEHGVGLSVERSVLELLRAEIMHEVVEKRVNRWWNSH